MDPLLISPDPNLLSPITPPENPAPPATSDSLVGALATALGRFSSWEQFYAEIGTFLNRHGISLNPSEGRRISELLAWTALGTGDSLGKAIRGGEKYFKRGMVAPEEVGLLQDLLRARGYPIDDRGGRYRGYFGPRTEAAVRAFQRREGLADDGIVGPQTLRALFGETPAPNPPPPSGQNIDAAGLELIAEFEAFRANIYEDATGHPTVGYGHFLRPGEAERFASGLSRDAALELLREDAGEAARAVNELVTVPLNQNQFNALVSFVFNVGRGNFAGSTLLRELNQGRYDRVAPGLGQWIYSDGVRLRGLERRRSREGNLFNTPAN